MNISHISLIGMHMNHNQLIEEIILSVLDRPLSNHEIASILLKDKRINTKSLNVTDFKSSVISPGIKRLKQKDKIWTIGNVQNTKHMKIRDALYHLDSEILKLERKISSIEDKINNILRKISNNQTKSL